MDGAWKRSKSLAIKLTSSSLLTSIAVTLLLILGSLWAFHLYGKPVTPSGTEFFTELTSIMGAIFVAGGLVIAVSTLLSLGTIDARVRQVAGEMLVDVKKEAAHELNETIAAYDLLYLARQWSQVDLRRAEHLTKEALMKSNTLPHARQEMGQSFYKVAFSYFFMAQGGDTTPEHVPMPPGSIRTKEAFFAYVYAGLGWFRDALGVETDENEKAVLAALCARLIGLSGDDIDGMLRYVDEAIRLNGVQYFSTPAARLCLAAGCRQQPQRFPDLVKRLPQYFPLRTDELRAAWTAYMKQGPPATTSGQQLFAFWVLRRDGARLGEPAPRNPGVIQLLPYAGTGVVIDWAHEEKPQRRVRIPASPNEAKAINETLEWLEERFYPICFAGPTMDTF